MIPRIGYNNQQQAGFPFDLVSLRTLFHKGLSPLLTKPHRLGFYQLLLFTQGNTQHWVDFKPYPCQAGTLLLVAEHQVQHFAPDVGAEALMILFQEAFLLGTYAAPEVQRCFQVFDEALFSPMLQLPTPVLQDLHRLTQLMLQEYAQEQVDASIRQGILRSYLHIVLLKVRALYQARIQQVERYSEPYQQFIQFKKCLQQGLTQHQEVQYYAEALGLSAKKLNAVVQGLTGQSAKRFIDSQRLLEVQRLLAGTQLSIKEVAYAAGFDEPTNLSKFFRRAVGQSAASFRAKFQP